MHPLSLLPQLFYLSPLSSALLRVAVAIIFLHLAYYYFKKRMELGNIEFLIIGNGVWIPLVTSVFTALVGAGLFFGYYTQLMAILAALFALKCIVWRRHYPAMFPYSRVTSSLLLVICLSLILTGAGAFAFDLPL